MVNKFEIKKALQIFKSIPNKTIIAPDDCKFFAHSSIHNELVKFCNIIEFKLKYFDPSSGIIKENENTISFRFIGNANYQDAKNQDEFSHKGHFSRLIKNIRKSGINIIISEPMPRMLEIIKKQNWKCIDETNCFERWLVN